MNNTKFEKKLGWDVPVDMIPCWLISDGDRINSLKKNKQFDDFSPTCFFKLTHRFDNNFIEGNMALHSYNVVHLHENIIDGTQYFDDYTIRKSVYFSFDRISLYKLIEIIPEKPLSFILRRIDNPKAITVNQAFMLMPFKDEKFNEFYKTNIRDYLKAELQINIYRADDFNGNDIIIDTILNQIENSEFVIVDTTNKNKNVFLEYGYAIAKDKEIIAIQNENDEKDLPFDRAHIRAILYSPEGVRHFGQKAEINNKLLK